MVSTIFFRRALHLAGAMLPLALAGCDTADDAGTPCDLSATVAASSIPVTATYRATETGRATVETLTYRTATGVATVTRPSLPWQAVVTLGPGTVPSVSAGGRVTEGLLALRVVAAGQSGGTTVNLDASDSCAFGQR